jgi:hypothetical protein
MMGETCKAQFIPGGSSRYLKWNDTTYVIVTWTRLDSIIAVIATPGGVTRAQVHDTADVLRREFLTLDTANTAGHTSFTGSIDSLRSRALVDTNAYLPKNKDAFMTIDQTYWKLGMFEGGSGDSVWITMDNAGNLVFRDEVTGTKTLAELISEAGGGTQYRSGNGPPSNSNWNNGDLYWDVTNKFMYHKVANEWRQDP